MPTGWGTWDFRDYSSTGTVPGITPAGHASLSYFNLANVVLNYPAERYSNGTGDSESLQIQALNAKAGQSLTYTATGLPPGATISGSGLITAAVTGTGYYVVYVTTTDPTTGATDVTWFRWYVGQHGRPR